jgi:inhibitor of cysteine peptidase
VKTHTRLVTPIAVAILIGAIHLEAAMTLEPKTVTVTEKENGSKIKVSKGDTLVLKLAEQPGTAFGWKIVKNNEDVLKPHGKPAVEKSDEKPKPGGKVTKVWEFKVESAGTSDLEMHLVRPFDKDKPPAKTFKLLVKAE